MVCQIIYRADPEASLSVFLEISDTIAERSNILREEAVMWKTQAGQFFLKRILYSERFGF